MMKDLGRRVEDPGSVTVLCPVILSSPELKLAFPKVAQTFTCLFVYLPPSLPPSLISFVALSQVRAMTFPKFQE